MKFKEILSRLTGISCPIFGVSWNPPALEVAAAKRLIRALEDRRVLYNPFELEDPQHCVHSVIEIRKLLTETLSADNVAGDFAANLRAIRAACRHFLDQTQPEAVGPNVRDWQRPRGTEQFF